MNIRKKVRHRRNTKAVRITSRTSAWHLIPFHIFTKHAKQKLFEGLRCRPWGSVPFKEEDGLLNTATSSNSESELNIIDTTNDASEIVWENKSGGEMMIRFVNITMIPFTIILLVFWLLGDDVTNTLSWDLLWGYRRDNGSSRRFANRSYLMMRHASHVKSTQNTAQILASFIDIFHIVLGNLELDHVLQDHPRSSSNVEPTPWQATSLYVLITRRNERATAP